MEFELIILDSRITPEMVAPATPRSAAIDLRACTRDTITIFSGDCVTVGTGICVNAPNEEYAMQLLPRSGLGSKGLVLGNLVGLIDPDYTGELKLVLWNRNPAGRHLNILPMDRVAQMVILPIIRPSFKVVTAFSKPTERGDGGFGSSGST